MEKRRRGEEWGEERLKEKEMGSGDTIIAIPKADLFF